MLEFHGFCPQQKSHPCRFTYWPELNNLWRQIKGQEGMVFMLPFPAFEADQQIMERTGLEMFFNFTD